MSLKTVMNGYKALLIGATGGDSYTTIGSGRAFTGWKASTINDSNLAEDLKASGAIAVIGLPTFEVDRNKVGPGLIGIDVYVYQSKEADWDGTKICDLVDDIKAKLMNIGSSQYNSSNQGMMPGTLSLESYEYLYQNCPGILVLHLSAQFTDPTDSKEPNKLREGL